MSSRRVRTPCEPDAHDPNAVQREWAAAPPSPPTLIDLGRGARALSDQIPAELAQRIPPSIISGWQSDIDAINKLEARGITGPGSILRAQDKLQRRMRHVLLRELALLLKGNRK